MKEVIEVLRGKVGKHSSDSEAGSDWLTQPAKQRQRVACSEDSNVLPHQAS